MEIIAGKPLWGVTVENDDESKDFYVVTDNEKDVTVAVSKALSLAGGDAWRVTHLKLLGTIDA